MICRFFGIQILKTPWWRKTRNGSACAPMGGMEGTPTKVGPPKRVLNGEITLINYSING